MRFLAFNLETNVDKSELKSYGKHEESYDYFYLFEKRYAKSLSLSCEKYTEELDYKIFIFLYGLAFNACRLCMLITENVDFEEIIRDIFDDEGLEIKNLDVREITISMFARMLSDAEFNDYLSNKRDVIEEEYGIYELMCGRPFERFVSYEEKIIRRKEREEIYCSANRCATKKLLSEELNRIFLDKTKKKAYGHPVQYMIESNDRRTINETVIAIIQSLYAVGRIENQRYCEVRFDRRWGFEMGQILPLFNSCIGGTIVVSFDGKKQDDSDISYSDYNFLDNLCKVMRRYSKEVLTIICLPRENKYFKKKIHENMVNITYVEIKEDEICGDEIDAYFKDKAKENNIRVDKKLSACIDKEKGYDVSTLNEIFDEWYMKKLKTSIYSQYREFSTVEKSIKKEQPVSSAYDKLESMVGLDSAKKIIYRALDNYKAQVIFRDKGIKKETYCNHMIFTGNPGTAKTTVARLFARILKDYKVLSIGHIIEVGRGDLVGKYVGWTAKIIKEKFKNAKGGILFIDEAYSLVDDRNGSFGDEAINTVVQEMENHREDVIVIFAGYPDKMEEFLNKNPGLRSRIAHHIHFEDYSLEELSEIARHIAKEKELVIDDDAMNKVRDIIENNMSQKDFGNGRFVRNLIERAKVAHNSRLVHLDYDEVTVDDVKTIRAEDIETPEVYTQTARVIGF